MAHTLQIIGNSPEAMQFLENARTLPFIRVIGDRSTSRKELAEDDIPFERIPGLPYTHEERLASVRRSMEDIRAGRVISHEDLMKEARTWGR